MEEPQPGRRSVAGRATIAAVALAVALALALAVGAGAVAGQDIDVTRTNPSTVAVTINTSSFENATGPTDTNISVGQATVTRKTNFSVSKPKTHKIPVTEFRNASGDLSGATVAVEVNGTRATASGVDLRHVETDGEAGFDGRDRQVVLPVREDSVVGIPDDTTVPVNVSADSGPISVEGTYQSGEIRVPISTFRNQLSVYGPLSFDPLPGLAAGKYGQINLRDESRVYLTPGSDDATISHPLVFAEESYSVFVTTSNPNGTFSRTMTASKSETGGALSIPAEILYANRASVTINRGETTIYPTSEGDLDELFEGVGTDEINVSLANPPSEQPPVQRPSAVWIENSSTLDRYDGSQFVKNGSFDYAALSEVGPRGEFAALLVGDGDRAVLRVSPGGAGDLLGNGTGPNGNGTGASGNGTAVQELIPDVASSNAVLLIGLVLGLLAGGVGYVLAQRPTPPKKGTHMAAAAAILVFGPFVGWEIAASQPGYVAFFVLFGLAFAIVDRAKRTRHAPLAVIAMGGLIMAMGVLGVAVVLPDGSVLWPVDFESPALGLAGIAYGALFAVPTVVLGLSRETGGQSAQPGGAPAPTRRDVTVTVQDGTETPIRDGISVTLTHARGATKQVQVDGGSARVSLREGDWEAEARYDGRVAWDTARVSRSGGTLVLEFPAVTIGVEAVDGKTGDPVSGADVTVTAGGQPLTGQTDESGRWQQTLPRSTGEVTVEIEHWRYEDASWTADPRRENTKRVTLRPLVGTLAGSVTIDGRGVPEIPVEATHERTGDRLSDRTDRQGRVTFPDVPIGEYRVEASLRDRPAEFSAGRAVARVRDGKQADAEMSVQFDYTLSREARRRIQSLEDRIDEIGAVSRRDSAIPNYYASVLRAALDAVEEVPRAGHPLLTAGVDPEAAVDALLTAVEEATDTVDRVMNSKRNVDLFSACSDFEEASVTWSGTVSVEQVTDLARKDIGEQRGLVLEDLEAVDDHISEAVGDVAEVSPAREMWEGVRTMARDNTGASQVESAALIVVAQALLDAVEALFERDQLRKRLERTVY